MKYILNVERQESQLGRNITDRYLRLEEEVGRSEKVNLSPMKGRGTMIDWIVGMGFFALWWVVLVQSFEIRFP